MNRTIAERLAETASRTFVGRSAELDVFAQALSAEELPFLVAFVHGPGGIGKSRFLQALVASLDAETRVLLLDCRDIEPTPRGFQRAAGRALGIGHDEPDLPTVVAAIADGGGRTVLALDTYEVFGLLDAWLRTVLLPALPASVLTVIAGRERPAAAWRTGPGWAGLVREIPLGALGQASAIEMLRSRGLTELQAARANRSAHGHPLALELAAAALRSDPDLDLGQRAQLGAADELLDAFLTRLPPDAVTAVEAASTARRVTEPILRALLDRDGVREEFEALRRLPFAERTADGLLLHDVVRDTVERDLAVRDPDAHARYRRNAASFFTGQARRPRVDLWQATADLIYLIKNPVLREACFPHGGADYSVEPARPGDGPAIRATARSSPRSTRPPPTSGRVPQRPSDAIPHHDRHANRRIRSERRRPHRVEARDHDHRRGGPNGARAHQRGRRRARRGQGSAHPGPPRLRRGDRPRSAHPERIDIRRNPDLDVPVLRVQPERRLARPARAGITARAVEQRLPPRQPGRLRGTAALRSEAADGAARRVPAGVVRMGRARSPHRRERRTEARRRPVRGELRQGWERIEITQRVATHGTWQGSPFGRACLPMRPGRALVGTRQGRYGIGTEIPSHLWWRRGPLLYTVSGPYPKRALVAIAESLKPIA